MAAQQFPALTGRVVDGANVIPADVEARLTQKLAALETQTQRQVVVATLPDLQGYEISDYGYQLGRKWGLGDKQRNDGEIIRGGLAWLNTESFKRHQKRFDELTEAEQSDIVDDICDAQKAKPEDRVGVTFFKEFRQLCLGGYYTHSATWKHLGYVGNVTVGGPYPGVPKEVIEKYGLQDVA